MKHAPNTINYLRKFCDGTGLGPFEIDELKAAGFIARNAQDGSWFVTATGHVALQQAQQELPLGDDMTQGADDDSYWPQRTEAAEHQVEQDAINQRMRNALDTVKKRTKQEGGSHYVGFAIQPVDFIEKNNIPYIEGNVVKYIVRHAAKGGVEDVRKAIHYCEMLLEMRYGVKA